MITPDDIKAARERARELLSGTRPVKQADGSYSWPMADMYAAFERAEATLQRANGLTKQRDEAELQAAIAAIMEAK